MESLFDGGVSITGGAVRRGVRLLALGVLRRGVIPPEKEPEAKDDTENEDE